MYTVFWPCRRGGRRQRPFHRPGQPDRVETAGSAATAPALCGLILTGLRSAAAFPAVSSQHTVDDGSGAADARLNADCARRTISAARAAFHAGVAIIDLQTLAVHFEYPMRANIQAHAAAGAFLRIQRQGGNIFQINHTSHFYYSHRSINDVIQTIRPTMPAVISRGRANRISFFTPESDV